MITRPLVIGAVLALTVVGASLVYAFVYSPTQPRQIIQFTTIAQGLGAYRAPAENLVLNDEASWERTWAKAFCDSPNLCPAAPEVDFNSTTVIAIFMGWQPTFGYSIAITDISRVGSNVLVNIRALSQDPNATRYRVHQGHFTS